MPHRTAAALTVHVTRTGNAIVRRLRDTTGQGTVEYVALMLLVAGILAGVIAWAKGSKGDAIGGKVVQQLTNAIDAPGKQK